MTSSTRRDLFAGAAGLAFLLTVPVRLLAQTDAAATFVHDVAHFHPKATAMARRAMAAGIDPRTLCEIAFDRGGDGHGLMFRFTTGDTFVSWEEDR
ncbi:hypothetical protein ASD89_24110 [Caulobacter sp. Root656]|nr:hypothetical protein ASD89_24110 [Caulobacter sp. Root656]